MLKRFKIPLIIISGLLLAFLSLHLIVQVWITPVMEALFTESVSYYSSGLYTVTYAEMDVKPIQQKVTFQNFHLLFDSTKVDQADSLRQKKWIELELDNFEITLDNFWTMIPGRYLKINQLIVNHPRLKVYDFSKEKTQKLNLESISRFDAHQLIAPYFDSLDVVSLNIHEAYLSWIKSAQTSPFGLGGINAVIRDLRIDATTVNQNYGYPQAERFEVRLNDASFFSQDSLYAIQLDEVIADPVQHQLRVKGLSLKPRHSVYQFSHAVGHQVSRVELRVDEVNFQNIDLHYLVSEQAFLVRKIRVKQPELSVFKDKRLLLPKASVKPLLQETLRNIPVAFCLDTLQLQQGKIHYQEHVDEAARVGAIHFDKIFVSGYNITNVDSLRKKGLLMEADIKTNFMGESLLELKLDVPLNDPEGYHRLQGEMKELSLQSVNNMLENTAFASVESGHAYTLKFDMQLNNQRSVGDMQFAYRDLKIRLLDKENPEKSNLKQQLHSWLANWMVVKTNNPDNSRKPLRIGEISFERNSEKSIFNFWWKSLLSGIKGSVGIGEHHSSATVADSDDKQLSLFKKLFHKETENE
jgi:hypothetical protein